MRHVAVVTLALMATAGGVHGQRSPAQPEATRSPTTAAVLGILPGFVGVHGLGSYYAEHSAHGTRHLLVGLGSLGLVMAGVSACESGLGVPSVWEGGCGGASTAFSLLGALSYLANWGWSTVVATRDAREYGVRRGGPASVAFRPRLIDSRGEPSAGIPRRVRVQWVEVVF